jgi:hypothetical protein
MPGRWGTAFAIALLAGGACVTESVPSGPPDAGQSRFARVLVDVSLPRDGEPTVSSQARFVKVTDMDVEAAQVLAGATTVPAELLPAGRCVRLSSERLVDDALTSASPDAQVTMMDAGDLVVLAAGRPDRLTPRYMPEIIPFVSGVGYGSEAAAASAPLDLSDDAEVQVSGFGGPDVKRFDTSVRLPTAPVITSVGGVDPAEAPVVIDRGADLDVAWAESVPRGEDLVVVDIGWGGADSLRCRADAAQHLVVPQAALAEALRGADATSLTVSVERVRRVPWSAPGLDGADLIVSVRDVVPARLP